MTTIGDVARTAGVSRSTVSSVLTGRKFVTPQTRARVEDAIKQLHFTVNYGARALATSRTMNIGLVFSFRQSMFVPAASIYVVALAEEARLHGYRLMLVTGDDSAADLDRLLASRSVDGLVVMEVVEDDPRMEALRSAPVPSVLIGMPRESAGVDAVDLDYSAAGQLAMDQVHAAGNRRVALATWPFSRDLSGPTYAHRFLSGAERRASELDLDLAVFPCDVDQHSIRECAVSILRDRGHDAFVFHNDAVAPILPTALLLEHREDLQVLGLCPPAMAREHWLPFDTIGTQPEECARIAIQLLVQRLNGGSVATGDGSGAEDARTRGTDDHRRILLEPCLTPGAPLPTRIP